MTRHCTALILSKRGFGEGHLLLTVLDADRGKTKYSAFGAALETGVRRAALLSGSFIQGLISPSKIPQFEILNETQLLFSAENLRSDLKLMGFLLFTLEILDKMLMEEELFEYFDELFETFRLFDENQDEKYTLFFLSKFLSSGSWLEIPQKQKLSAQTKRFINDSNNYPSSFLQGKNISNQRKHELSYFFAHAVKHARGYMPCSLELLKFN